MTKQKLIEKLNQAQIESNNLPSQAFYNAIEFAIKLAQQLDEPCEAVSNA